MIRSSAEGEEMRASMYVVVTILLGEEGWFFFGQVEGFFLFSASGLWNAGARME